jgi:hypothetical protein
VCVNDIAPSQAKMDRLVAELNETRYMAQEQLLETNFHIVSHYFCSV